MSETDAANAITDEDMLDYRAVTRFTQHEEGEFAVAPSTLSGEMSSNRYCDVLPLERTRVQLSTHEYLNANNVQLLGQHYILCQAPLPNTLEVFWRMIWEQRVAVVVMLTALEENGRIKAHRYWPDTEAQSLAAFELRLLRAENHDGMHVRCVQLTHAGEAREISLIQDTRWRDHGCPRIEHIPQLLAAIETHRTAACTRGLNGPLVIHCSAGIGRSGLLTVLHALRDQAPSREDIIDAVVTLRHQRDGAVQTLCQFSLLFRFLLQTNTEDCVDKGPTCI